MIANNVRKAAILLASLPEEEAAQILSRLKPKQIEAVSIEIARLEHVTGDELESTIYEFADANPNAMISAAGGLERAKSLVQRALGKEAGDTLDNVQQTIEALPFGFLKKVDPENLVSFINEEHPQTIALILCHLPPSYGAQVIAALPVDRQLSVVQRIAMMGQMNPEVIREVEAGLESRMESLTGQAYENAGGTPTVAEILNVTDRSTERSILENLAQDDPDLVDEIRRLMFIFDDITKLGDKDIQTVLKNVESSQWAVALKGASSELKEKILGNMSQRAAQMLQEEMEYAGPVRVSEVETVQQQVVDIIRRLEDSGLLSTHAEEADDEMIE